MLVDASSLQLRQRLTDYELRVTLTPTHTYNIHTDMSDECCIFICINDLRWLFTITIK
jgi:hypothetical protein